MASYHCTVSFGCKGKASSHASYIAREEKYSEKEAERYEDLEAKECGNMPDWAKEKPLEFWKASDEYERANGSAYREIEIALPRELTPSQRLDLVRDFVDKELCNENKKHAYQFAIHNPKAAIDGGEQPHAHIMYSQRIDDGLERSPDQYFKRYNAKNPERGGCKKDSGTLDYTARKKELVDLRERFANVQNKHLKKHGFDTEVSHLSLRDRGLNYAPEKHLGAHGVRQFKLALVEHEEAKKSEEIALDNVQSVYEETSAQERQEAEARATREREERERQEAEARATSEREERERQEAEARATSERERQEMLANAFKKANSISEFAELPNQYPELAPAVRYYQSVVLRETMAYRLHGQSKEKTYENVSQEKQSIVKRLADGEPMPKPVNSEKKAVTEPTQQKKPPKMRM